MRKLSLFFTKNGIHWQISKGKEVLGEEMYYLDEDSFLNLIEERLEDILSRESYENLEIVSAFNCFSLAPDSFPKDDLGFDLIKFNSPIQKNVEELMLSVNRKFEIQFFYTFPLYFYQRIKILEIPTVFHFSGERFLNKLHAKSNQKEIHIHLLKNQVEFLALHNKKTLLYNNLDAASEVDFLYFIMFTLKKIDFEKNEAKFYLYGEISEHETFVSELKKFVKHLSIVFENKANHHFIFQ